jgi:hypothetical protein
MTPAAAAAATRVRQLITEAYQTDATYRAVVDAALRDLAHFPIRETRTSECVSACPQPVEGQIAGRIFLSSRRTPTPAACTTGGRGEGGQG